jgi:hypothetical protein
MAMEEELAQAEATNPMTTLDDAEGSAETAMLEAGEMSTEVEGQMDEITLTEDSTDELTALADVMQKTTENGGMDETTAEVIEVAVEGIYARMGVRGRAKMPAMEAFGSKTTRLQVTMEAIADIKAFVAKAWKAILDAIVGASEAIMSFFKKLLIGNERMLGRAKAFKDQAEKLTTDKSETENISSGSFGGALAIQGKVSGAEVTKGITTLIEALNKAGEKAGKAGEMAGKVDGEPAGVDLGMGASVGAGDGFEEGPEGMTVSRSAELPGGAAFVSQFVPGGKMTPEQIKATMVMVGRFEPKAEAVKIEEAPTLTKAEMIAIADEVTKLGAAVTKNKAEAEKLYSARKALVEKIKGLMNKPADDATKAGQALATTFNKLSKSFMMDFSKYSVSTGLQALNYVQKSMEQFKVAPKPKAEAAAA